MTGFYRNPCYQFLNYPLTNRSRFAIFNLLDTLLPRPLIEEAYMTPRQQRYLLMILLAAGLLIILMTTFFALTRTQRDIQIATPAEETSPPNGFTFFDLHRATVLNRDLRRNLSQTLGSDAIAHATPIDLTMIDREFFKTHLPVLDGIHQRLNPPLAGRREHDTTRLTYHRAQTRQMPFRFIELVFSNRTGRPLYFTIHPSADFGDSIATLTSKYGPPRVVETGERSAPVYIWKQGRDILVATVYRRRSGRLSQEMRIYFVDNLEQYLENEALKRQQEAASTSNPGRRAF